MSGVKSVLSKMKKSGKVDSNVADWIERVAISLNKNIQKQDERIKSLEAKHKKNITQLGIIQDSINSIESRYTESDYIAYYERAIKKLDNLEQAVQNLNIDSILKTYGNKAAITEMKNVIQSKQKITIKSSLGDVFRKSICNNDLASVEFLYPYININDKFSDGASALNVAIQNKCKEISIFLLEKGSNVTKKDITSAPSDLQSILRSQIEKMKPYNFNNNIFVAAKRDDVVSIKYLVQFCDANVHDKDKEKRTILHIASENANLELVKYLTQKCHANVDEKDINGRTALHIACESDNVDLVKYLVEDCNANIEGKTEEKDHKGNTANRRTALHIACEKGNLNVVKYLVGVCHINIEERDKYKRTALHFACESGNTELVKYLVEECRASVKDKDNKGKTPLHAAIECGKLNVVKCLVKECKASISDKTNEKEGRNALHIACQKGNFEIFKYLVEECQADVEEKTKEKDLLGNKIGRKVLHIASETGDLKIFKYLVEECHANPEEKTENWEKRTPLHIACLNNNLEITKYLIDECHVDMDVNDNQDNKPIKLTKSDEIKKFFRSKDYKYLN